MNYLLVYVLNVDNCSKPFIASISSMHTQLKKLHITRIKVRQNWFKGQEKYIQQGEVRPNFRCSKIRYSLGHVTHRRKCFNQVVFLQFTKNISSSQSPQMINFSNRSKTPHNSARYTHKSDEAPIRAQRFYNIIIIYLS